MLRRPHIDGVARQLQGAVVEARVAEAVAEGEQPRRRHVEGLSPAASIEVDLRHIGAHGLAGVGHRNPKAMTTSARFAVNAASACVYPGVEDVDAFGVAEVIFA